ncbi:MAG: hypothetical protein DRI39_04725 [Chloroflexi bacterium]|nr:MAG: hypothetical protein DRI39_04725 [Chloroflexota bacterium]
MAKQSYDAIVIGAGFGGAACAGLLAKHGLSVLLLDKNAKAGGKAMAFSKKGFTYTAWMVCSAPTDGNVLEAVLKELEMEDRVTLVAPGIQGSRFKNSKGEWPISPQDKTPDPNKIFDWLEVPEADRADALQVLADLTMMSPDEIAKLDDISFAEWLGRYKINKNLYSFLIGPVSDGCFMVPVDALAASEAVGTIQQVFLRGGGVFAHGGIGRVAETYADAVKENGGRVIMRCRVEKITVEDGKVTGVITSKGTFKAPIVVSNAGIQPTVLKLVGEQHFDQGYVNYVKGLLPSIAMVGVRYFTNKVVIKDVPYGTIFTPDTPMNMAKWMKAKTGAIPDEITVWYEVPSNYDPNAAPPGKQVIVTGIWAPCDPKRTKKDHQPWWDKVDEMMFKVFPDLPNAIEWKEGYSSRDVSNLTRDQVLPGIGGECIGLGQIVGQAGGRKPPTTAPIQGLFFVGCDAGGTGIGIQQATDSGVKVARMVERYHAMRQAII